MQDSWICTQIGSREHYLVPRSLKKLGHNVSLITDLWIRPKSLISRVYPQSRTRYHSDLIDIDVVNFNTFFLGRRIMSYSRINWDILFDSLASKRLKRMADDTVQKLFTNSYASLETLKTATTLGLPKIYQQINPGPAEAEIVKEVYKSEFGNKYNPSVPSPEYWERWYEEVTYPDTIIVNSEWSRKLMLRAGVEKRKITVIPFTYQGKVSKLESKNYPSHFSFQRPLKILYLGSISLRKGFHILKRAMAGLKSEPVILNVVGRLNGPPELLQDLPSNIRYHGMVSSFATDSFYMDADLFILPTFSDGFALTQLEAFAYKLPLIVTSFCGNVVDHLSTGYIINDVTVAEIGQAIRYFIDQPDKLQQFSQNIPEQSDDPLEKYASAVINASRQGKIMQKTG